MRLILLLRIQSHFSRFEQFLQQDSELKKNHIQWNRHDIFHQGANFGVAGSGSTALWIEVMEILSEKKMISNQSDAIAKTIFIIKYTSQSHSRCNYQEVQKIINFQNAKWKPNKLQLPEVQ